MGRGLEGFLIGLVCGALAVLGWATAALDDAERKQQLQEQEIVVVRDTVRAACCDELLEHYAQAHRTEAR